MLKVVVNLDVDDIERAIFFYTRGLELKLGRRFDPSFVELLGAEVPIYLLLKEAASAPFEGALSGRDYTRHWTPVHLDFVVPDINAALQRAVIAGAVLESEVTQHAYGKLARLSDPFGHGFCLLEFKGKGYGEIEDPNDPGAALARRISKPPKDA
jgi:predicted enzyme related to lactoylglutathione lyase